MLSNTTRQHRSGFARSRANAGASKRQLLFRVVIPGVITEIYTDMRVLLGWAWTYLIVAELIGVSSGITLFHQPASQVPRLRQGLRVDHPDWSHRARYRFVPRFARTSAVPVAKVGAFGLARAHLAALSEQGRQVVEATTEPVASSASGEPSELENA